MPEASARSALERGPSMLLGKEAGIFATFAVSADAFPFLAGRRPTFCHLQVWAVHCYVTCSASYSYLHALVHLLASRG
jgi:hypothetical protein